MAEQEKHARLPGKLVFVGFGSVGQGVLPLLLRHLEIRDDGVLIVGSGNLVHNLHAYAWGQRKVEPFDWAVSFEARARELLLAGQHEPLIAYETLGSDAALSVPTPDHYLPLLYVIAQQREGDEVSFPVEGFDGGTISMLTVRIG